MDETTDLRNFRPRLIRLGVAAVIGAVLTWFTIQSMTNSGRGPNHDPIGASSVGVLAIAIFVMTTLASYAIIASARGASARARSGSPLRARRTTAGHRAASCRAA